MQLICVRQMLQALHKPGFSARHVEVRHRPRIEPGKRLLSSVVPTFVKILPTANPSSYSAVPAGRASSPARTIMNLIEFRMSPADAVTNALSISVLPVTIFYETNALLPEALRALTVMGYQPKEQERGVRSS